MDNDGARRARNNGLYNLPLAQEVGASRLERIKDALDVNFPAYRECLGKGMTCPHHLAWPEELEVFAGGVAEDLGGAVSEPVGEAFFDRRRAAWRGWAEENRMDYHSPERDIFFDAYDAGFTAGGEW